MANSRANDPISSTKYYMKKKKMEGEPVSKRDKIYKTHKNTGQCEYYLDI